MSETKKIISPISCETEPMSTIFDNIKKFANLKDIPFSLAVRKFLIAGDATMKRMFRLKGMENGKS